LSAKHSLNDFEVLIDGKWKERNRKKQAAVVNLLVGFLCVGPVGTSVQLGLVLI
jgi:hypothetical protein